MAGSKRDWWVVWNAGTGAIDVVQSSTKPATPASGKVFGPYTTKAQAQSEANPNSSLFQQAALGANAGLQQSIGTPGNPLAFLGYLGEIGHWIGKFVTDITDVHMWISLGWLFLGLVLLVLGILAWLKHENLLPPAPVPVPV